MAEPAGVEPATPFRTCPASNGVGLPARPTTPRWSAHLVTIQALRCIGATSRPHDYAPEMERTTGLEPATSTLATSRSASLSYVRGGAGDRDRTGVPRVETWRSTIELHPRGGRRRCRSPSLTAPQGSSPGAAAGGAPSVAERARVELATPGDVSRFERGGPANAQPLQMVGMGRLELPTS